MSRGDTGTCCSVCDDWYYYATRGGVPVEDLATPPAFAELLLAMARSARREAA